MVIGLDCGQGDREERGRARDSPRPRTGDRNCLGPVPITQRLAHAEAQDPAQPSLVPHDVGTSVGASVIVNETSQSSSSQASSTGAVRGVAIEAVMKRTPQLGMVDDESLRTQDSRPLAAGCGQEIVTSVCGRRIVRVRWAVSAH